MLLRAVPVLLALVLVSTAALADDDETYLGFKLITTPWGSVKHDGRSGEDDLRFGYGLGVWLEGSLFSFLSLGGTVEYRRLAIESYDDQGSALHLSPLVRLYFPGRMFEPYFKGQLGLTLMWPPEGPSETDFGPGFNWEAILGLMIRWDSFGIFAEIGIGQTTGETYVHDPGADYTAYEDTFDISYLDANVGLVFIF